MMTTSQPEAWLRGPLDGVPALLMPVAHALLHAKEDATHALDGLDAHQIWKKAGTASIGFHVRHLTGALDRLLTYAKGGELSAEQRAAARLETEPGDSPADAGTLVGELDRAIARAMAQVRATREDTLLEARAVGRQHLPSNVLGLLFHAAEHAARHAGQAITTSRIVRASERPAR